jgi:hypothetical protein
MSARCLLVAALLTVAAAPAGAQEYVWTDDRPDAEAPLGVFGARTLSAGALQITALYSKMDQSGIRLGSQLVDPSTLFDSHEIVPFDLTTTGYVVRGAYGLSDDLTLAGRVGFQMRDRWQRNQEDVFFQLESSGITDLEVQALYDVYESGPYRAHLHAGVTIPTGSVTLEDGVEGLREEGHLPYDMQIGSGAFGFSPGVTAQAMNENGSVGAQVLATLFFLEKEDWRLGDRVEANMWAGFRLNRFFSASVRVRATAFEEIDGFDPQLDPARDPGEYPFGLSGRRVDIPVGLNFYMPEGRWQGHRGSLEFVFPAHEQFDDWAWLASDWGFEVGWQKTF